jgi:hypothetical protein
MGSRIDLSLTYQLFFLQERRKGKAKPKRTNIKGGGYNIERRTSIRNHHIQFPHFLPYNLCCFMIITNVHRSEEEGVYNPRVVFGVGKSDEGRVVYISSSLLFSFGFT